MEVSILVTEGCPHIESTIQVVRDVLAVSAPEVEAGVYTVRDREEAQDLKFPGSPTVRVNGIDLEGPGIGPPAFACRRYGVSGTPPRWLVEAAILKALSPKHILFLCVQNSARSQLAEGIGRSLAGEDVRISSAGSSPTAVRPEAIQVLKEIGIDISSQLSVGFDDVEGPVDLVVTLCQDEACPAWLDTRWRVHWGLPDPAQPSAPEAERIADFRDLREELRFRLGYLLRGRAGE
jgi:arsenate reductase